MKDKIELKETEIAELGKKLNYLTEKNSALELKMAENI